MSSALMIVTSWDVTRDYGTYSVQKIKINACWTKKAQVV